MCTKIPGLFISRLRYVLTFILQPLWPIFHSRLLKVIFVPFSLEISLLSKVFAFGVALLLVGLDCASVHSALASPFFPPLGQQM